MKPVAADYGYDVAWNDDHYVISYKRGQFGAPYILLLIIPCFALAIATTVVISRLPLLDQIPFIFMFLFFGFGFLAGAIYYLNTLRKPRTIAIYKDSVLLNGLNYEQQHIKDLYVSGPNIARASVQLDNRVSTGSMLGAAGVFGVAGVAASGLGALTQATNNVGALIGGAGVAISNSQKKKSGWSIHFDYGQKPVRVAYGLNEKQAAAMAQDLYRLIFVEF